MSSMYFQRSVVTVEVEVAINSDEHCRSATAAPAGRREPAERVAFMLGARMSRSVYGPKKRASAAI